MKKNKIIVIFSTHLSEEENAEFVSHVDKTIGCTHETHGFVNFNEKPLHQIYNDAINEYSAPNAVFVFCHNDIIFKTHNWGKPLLKKFNSTNYGILGVAGTSYIPESGRWWDDRSKMYGTVEHTNGVSNWLSVYSSKIKGIKDVVHVDGLFIAVDQDMIHNKFNGNYGKFHFYDITFCLDNYFDGVDIGVVSDIDILHKSVGMTNQEWEDNRIKFVEEYGDSLPIKLVSNKLRVLLCCQFFTNYTGSEVSNYELAKELVLQGCEVTVISTIVGDPILRKANNAGIKIYQLPNAPNYRMNEHNHLQFIKTEQEFDIIHINHKPIGTEILKMYPNTPAVMHVRSEVIPTFEEPIINPQIKRYISIRDSIREYIKTFGVSDEAIVDIDNPFDYKRFNSDYLHINNKDTEYTRMDAKNTRKQNILFVGTLDHLRKNILLDLKQTTKENNQELWIIGADNGGYINEILDDHVIYHGTQSNVEQFIKKCDFTAGIFKGRTTIEGYLCGKPGWIYKVDKLGNIIEKEFNEVPNDLIKYRSDISAKKVITLYNHVIDETWF